MVATNKGYMEEMDALLKGGADVNATHEVKKLISIKINISILLINPSQGTGWTAIFFAAKNGNVEFVQNFLHHKAKIELDVSCKHGVKCRIIIRLR